jgi:hypothetical protein
MAPYETAVRYHYCIFRWRVSVGGFFLPFCVLEEELQASGNGHFANYALQNGIISYMIYLFFADYCKIIITYLIY